MKKSFGTAIKFFGEGWWPNLTTYAKLGVLTFLVLREPGLMGQLEHGHMNGVVQQVARNISAQNTSSVPPVVQFSAGAAPVSQAAVPWTAGPPPAWHGSKTGNSGTVITR